MNDDTETRRQRELRILGAFPQAERWHGESEDYERGVLLNDKIERYVREYGLIDPFNPMNLKPAAYELSVGSSYAMDGETGRLDPADTKGIVIQPFGVVIVQTLERLNMPNFLIGRWNIRVTWAYQGLLWVGGPQVDPGFRGYLFCPLYNLSDKPVTIRYGECIAVIDFVTTTMPIHDRSKTYPPPERRDKLLIENYNPQLKSALVERVTKRLDEVDSRMLQLHGKTDRTQDRLDVATSSIFTSLGILFAAIIVFNGIKQQVDPYLFWVGIVSTACAVVVALFVYNLYKTDAPERQRRATGGRKLLLLVAAALVLVGVPYGVYRIVLASTSSALSAAQAREASDSAAIRLLSCQVRAMASKRSISTCR